MIGVRAALGELAAFPVNRVRIVKSHDAHLGWFVQHQFVAIGVHRRPGGQGGSSESESSVVAVLEPERVAIVALDQCIELTVVFIIACHNLIIFRLDKLCN